MFGMQQVANSTAQASGLEMVAALALVLVLERAQA